jgi:hypothetical protein
MTTTPPALATVNGLMRATQVEVELSPELEALLSRKTVIVRRIPPSTFYALFPYVPAEVAMAGPEEATLPPEERRRLQAERVRYRVDVEQVKYRALALTLVEPRMTEEEVERLGDEVEPIYRAMLRLSKLLKEPETETASKEAVASEAPSA